MKVCTFLLTMGLAVGATAARAQEAAEELTKKELPRKAVCVVCDTQGMGEGEETVVAGVRYKGKVYFFCNKSEVAKFRQDPAAYIPLPLPRPMPDFRLKTLDETPLTSRSYRGKVMLVDFWATYCKPCVEVMPELQKLADKYAAKGLVVLGVSLDEKGAKVVKPFLEKRKFTYPIALDNASEPAWQAFGVRALPTLFLVNAEGQIVRQWTGKPDKKQVEEAVQSLLKATSSSGETK
jgi:peroxiredoxin